MTFSALYLLPAVAVVIILQGSLVFIRGNLQYRSRRFQRRARSRALFYRCLVVSLLVATLMTKLWNPPGLPLIVQGVLITVALMIPVALYTMVVYLQTRSSGNQATAQTRSSDADNTNEQSAAAAVDVMPAKHTTAERKKKTRTKAAPKATAQATAQAAAQASSKPEANSRTNTSLHSRQSLQRQSEAEQSQTEESALDQTLSVDEQLESLDDLVDFHDIGNEAYAPVDEAEMTSNEVINPLEKAIAIAREGILEEPLSPDYANENLPARSSTELAEMVVRLRSDKMKLQKLVIAQKAVIDAEKQAHERTRVVVKDAISVMRHARHGQRIAEKIARRERAERQRLEKDFDKVKRQLDNALSTVTKSADSRTQTEEA